MSDVVQDPVVVDIPSSGGIDFPADMVSTTSDAPVAAKVEEKPAAKVEEKAADSEPDKPEFKKPAWVRWTDEGGMRIEPGSGASVDEHGNITIDPEVAQRMATKRVMRTRDEERARADRLLREERAKFERELAEARGKPKDSSDKSTDKPWASKGAAEPDLDDFDTVPEFTKAMIEWDRAQREDPKPDTKDDGPKLDSDGLPTRDSFESDEEWNEAVADAKFDRAHGEHIQAVLKEGAALYEDYQQIVGTLTPPRETLEAILDSDNSAEILYHLGSHPDELEKLQGLSGSRLHKAIGRIEDALSTPQGTVVSNAPTATPKGPSIQPVPVIKPTRGAAPPRTNPVELAAQPDADAYFAHLKSIGV